ncbi:transcriptional regulator, HxlR family [Polaromonas sp. YR568]|uniref:winged helix-turn-helix transcriptional regulator n=1 Tax=Polaromonas sp. YR568 TaxID=1855301 RepID=UPI0008EC8636|nr:helix-turn-helix domain-containing protein [Polaromonas sp. YR568]SFU40585.1 transcriptional regulator, HxlR family [Polaromonas sp. YR568]
MPRFKPSESLCSVVRSLDLLGDRWTLLLIREVVFGTRRFDDFAAHLGIARNVLSTRLAKLVEAGVLMQEPLQAEGRRQGYRLTEMGEDLLPVLMSLMQWGDRWLQTPETIPIRIVERATGKPLPALRVRNAAGQVLALADLDWEPGPGAGNPLMAPLVAAYEAQRRTGPRPVPEAVDEDTPTPVRRKKAVKL